MYYVEAVSMTVINWIWRISADTFYGLMIPYVLWLTTLTCMSLDSLLRY